MHFPDAIQVFKGVSWQHTSVLPNAQEIVVITSILDKEMSGNYIIDKDGKHVLVEDVLVWAQWFENFDRRVGLTFLGKYHEVQVSTVFLGIDHSFMGGPPILYETMIFGIEKLEDFQTRCSTWEEAVEMHKYGIRRAIRFMRDQTPDIQVHFVCCKLGTKTRGKEHDRSCTGVPPRMVKRHRLRMSPYGLEKEEVTEGTQYIIDPMELAGCEVNEKGEVIVPDSRIFNIKLESQFIPTPTMVKNKLGLGYKVLAVELEKEYPKEQLKDVDSAVQAIIYTGYRALARAHHPDLGGDAEKMMILNKAKKEVEELFKRLKA